MGNSWGERLVMRCLCSERKAVRRTVPRAACVQQRLTTGVGWGRQRRGGGTAGAFPLMVGAF